MNSKLKRSDSYTGTIQVGNGPKVDGYGNPIHYVTQETFDNIKEMLKLRPKDNPLEYEVDNE